MLSSRSHHKTSDQILDWLSEIMAQNRALKFICVGQRSLQLTYCLTNLFLQLLSCAILRSVGTCVIYDLVASSLAYDLEAKAHFALFIQNFICFCFSSIRIVSII